MITEKYLRTCNAIHEVEEFVNCALFSKDYDSISLEMSNLALYENLHTNTAQVLFKKKI